VLRGRRGDHLGAVRLTAPTKRIRVPSCPSARFTGLLEYRPGVYAGSGSDEYRFIAQARLRAFPWLEPFLRRSLHPWPHRSLLRGPMFANQTRIPLAKRAVKSNRVQYNLTMPRSRLKSKPKRPTLSIKDILQWADDWFAEHGRWPNVNSGLIPATIDDHWARIDDGLRGGHRGLPKKSGLTLARLLEKRRGVRNSEYPPLLTEDQIVAWAKQHHRRTGKWPTENSGPILDATNETWTAIDLALRKGKRRGLPGGDSLSKLLDRRCGVRNIQDLPRLKVAQILRWADAYFVHHGKRPARNSGPIPQAPGETWFTVDGALICGRRGFPGGSSLAKLLAKHRPQWPAGQRMPRNVKKR
jgi:hypothetical protein